MGYSITIGNATPKFSKDDGELDARWEVEGVRFDDAPSFPNDEMTGKSNGRSPSYTGWADTCRAAGIYDLFLEKYEGLMSPHPGCKMILPEHLLTVRGALEKVKRQATLPPGFEGWPKFDESTGKHETPDAGKYDAVLARMIWLEWWMNWALENCETPAIKNT